MAGWPVVKILMRHWKKPALNNVLHEGEEIYKVTGDHGFEDGVTDDLNEDVGWMYMEVIDY
jgi:hypothetical protein